MSCTTRFSCESISFASTRPSATTSRKEVNFLAYSPISGVSDASSNQGVRLPAAFAVVLFVMLMPPRLGSLIERGS